MKKYKIGDIVKTDITDKEGVVIATDDRQDEFAKVKIKFNGIFGETSWEFESMVRKILTSN